MPDAKAKMQAILDKATKECERLEERNSLVDLIDPFMKKLVDLEYQERDSWVEAMSLLDEYKYQELVNNKYQMLNIIKEKHACHVKMAGILECFLKVKNHEPEH